MMVRLICLAVLLSPVVVSLGAAEADDKTLAEIKAKHDRGEKVTLEEQDLWSTSIERQNQESSAKRNADYARQHPARESTGLVPLPDLGKGLYQGDTRSNGTKLAHSGSNWTAPAIRSCAVEP